MLTGGAGGEQHQDGRRLVGLVAEAVNATRRDVEEVALAAVDPVCAVVELHRARQHEEGFRHRAVEVRSWSARLRSEVDAVQAVVTVGLLLGGEVVVLNQAEGVVVRRRPTVFGRAAEGGGDLRLLLGEARRRIGRDDK